MKLLNPATISSLLSGAFFFGTPSTNVGMRPAVSRRDAITAAGLAVAALPPVAPVFAEEVQDDAWTKHEGPFDDAFFADFQVSKAESSFQYKFLKDGDGGAKPVPNQKVSVNYRGYLLDGTLVDSSFGNGGKPFRFRLGKGKVILGWEGIVPGMTAGQRVIVRVPPQYAYGDKKVGKIPPNSPLVFYMELVELLDIKD